MKSWGKKAVLAGAGVLGACVLLSAWRAPAEPLSESKCVRVYYDASPDPGYALGRTYATFLSNLLGHFRKVRQKISPIELYVRGEIETCQATIYLASYFDNKVPEAFLEDFKKTGKNVAWLNYSLWKLGAEDLVSAFGVRYRGVAGLDPEQVDARGRPGFFRTVSYRGRQFEKYGEHSSDGRFEAAFELVRVEPQPEAGTEVIAEAVHSSTGERLPYAIRKANRFYVADIPFGFMHESDRYLVFADLLFDILDERPLYPELKPAVFRVEDVSSLSSATRLDELSSFLRENGVPFSVALIPVFADPLGVTRVKPPPSGLALKDDPELLKTVELLESRGASWVWHGVTHQLGEGPNPNSGVSGDDFEFWDMRTEEPVEGETALSLLERLDQGWAAMSGTPARTALWETPHYRASTLDHYLFARVFPWTTGRFHYGAHLVSGLPPDSTAFRYGSPGLEDELSRARKQALRNVQVSPQGMVYGQFFPYEIYGDVYGQRIVPENLGFPALRDSDNNSLRDMIDTVERNSVLRDSWASLFFHLGYLETHPDWRSEVRGLLKAVRASGHEFISVEAFVRDREEWKRPYAHWRQKPERRLR